MTVAAFTALLLAGGRIDGANCLVDHAVAFVSAGAVFSDF